jgi:hypothetical protein
MRMLLSVSAVAVAAAGLLAVPSPKSEPILFVNLKEYCNGKLDENLHSNNYENNNLKPLGTGKKKLGDVEFEIGAGFMQLGSSNLPNRPAKIEGIKVGRGVKKLHFLHACGYSNPEGKVIAKYVIRYADKSTAEIEVAYGRDVVDWWAYPDQMAPSKGKVAWEGENEAAKGFNAKIKLYLLTWENPKPDKEVSSIDFVATDTTQGAAPFCVAITADGK